jgi:hypothetical protein
MHRLGNAFLDIPFWPMMQTIVLVVVLPLVVGMAVWRLPLYKECYRINFPIRLALSPIFAVTTITSLTRLLLNSGALDAIIVTGSIEQPLFYRITIILKT